MICTTFFVYGIFGILTMQKKVHINLFIARYLYYFYFYGVLRHYHYSQEHRFSLVKTRPTRSQAILESVRHLRIALIVIVLSYSVYFELGMIISVIIRNNLGSKATLFLLPKRMTFKTWWFLFINFIIFNLWNVDSNNHL